MIFGLSLSVGALALIGSPPGSSGEINRHILAFMFTFLLLITSWIIYTSDMSVLPVETRLVTFLNVVLLLLVAIVPYLLNNVEFANTSLDKTVASDLQNYASILFAVDMAGILVILAVFAHVLALEEKQLVAPELVRRYRRGRNLLLFLALLLGFSLIPQFWNWTLFGSPVRLYIWYIPVITFWTARLLGRSLTIPRQD